MDVSNQFVGKHGSIFIDSLTKAERESISETSGSARFRFGVGGPVFVSERKVTFPAIIGSRKVSIEADIIECDLPLLLSKESMKKADTQINFQEDEVAPSLSSLKQMISICEEFAKSHSIVFNPSKTKLLCFNLDPLSEIPPIYLNGVQISIVEHEKHLGNYISTNISDRNIIANVCDLYQRSNLLISDFRVCDSQTLDCLHKTYCMHMYGSEL